MSLEVRYVVTMFYLYSIALSEWDSWGSLFVRSFD